MTPAELAQLEDLIRRVIREESMTYSGASLVSPVTEQQEAARRDAERELRMARKDARREAKKHNGGNNGIIRSVD